MQHLLFNARHIAIAAAIILMSAPLSLAAEAPTIAGALFEKSHLANLPAGTSLTYDFVRNGSEPRLIGPNFKDTITLDITDVADDGSRTVGVKVFNGERGRDERVIQGMIGNPVLVFFLDRAVANFSLLAGGNRAYHKNRFRAAMRTEGGLAPVSFEYDGKVVKGYRLAVRPFTGDRKNVDKMKGYENAHFEILMSDEVPGYFAEFTSHYDSPKPGSPSLDERIVLRGVNVAENNSSKKDEADVK
jgi:hypothetical protein